MDRIAFFSLFLVLISQLVFPVSANIEVDALSAFKVSLDDQNNALQSWDTTFFTPCTWGNVTCNSDNSVTRLDLGNANLSGRLVPELGQLVNLQYLELYSNNISGTIPLELGNLTNLVSLDLYSNRLSGPIPDTLVKLQKLRFLRLNNNSLSGTIPTWLTTANSIEILDLSNNMLTGGETPVEPANNSSFCLFPRMRLLYWFSLIINGIILQFLRLI